MLKHEGVMLVFVVVYYNLATPINIIPLYIRVYTLIDKGIYPYIKGYIPLYIRVYTLIYKGIYPYKGIHPYI